VDAGNATLTPLVTDGSSVLGSGWNESRFRLGSHTAAQGRVRITLNGGPGARASIARLRAYSV
jgi:hypothetical protein